MTLAAATDILHSRNCSCVIVNDDRTFIGTQRGIRDLYHLLKADKELLCGALMADKVVGKGAAALMALGGIAVLHADVVSRPALGLLESCGIEVEYGVLVDNIINCTKTGICPVEKLCCDCSTAQECLPLIENFLLCQQQH